MYQIKVDTHVHSIFTDHAYSTIEENARHAKECGLQGIAITDHFGPMFTTDLRVAIFNTMNREVLPERMHGVRILKGIEIDIVDFEGNLAYFDTPHPLRPEIPAGKKVLECCDLVIASVHQNPTFHGGTVEEHTKMYTNVIRNPYVDIIGHSGRSGMPYDIQEVIGVAKEEGKIIEINNHSMDFQNCIETCREIAQECAKQGVYITVSSDAHCAYSLGNYEEAFSLLESINFPEELIANATEERLYHILKTNREKRSVEL